MISRELLEAVFGDIDIEKSVASQPEYTTDISYVDIHGNNEMLDVHYLTYECKEWARNNKNYIMSEPLEAEWFVEVNKRYGFHGATEFEAVIRACEWILKKNGETK